MTKLRVPYYGTLCTSEAGSWLTRLDNMDLLGITRTLLTASHLWMDHSGFQTVSRACEIYTFRMYGVMAYRKDANGKAINKLANEILRLSKDANYVGDRICTWLGTSATLEDVISRLANGEPKYNFDSRIRGAMFLSRAHNHLLNPAYSLAGDSRIEREPGPLINRVPDLPYNLPRPPPTNVAFFGNPQHVTLRGAGGLAGHGHGVLAAGALRKYDVVRGREPPLAGTVHEVGEVLHVVVAVVREHVEGHAPERLLRLPIILSQGHRRLQEALVFHRGYAVTRVKKAAQRVHVQPQDSLTVEALRAEIAPSVSGFEQARRRHVYPGLSRHERVGGPDVGAVLTRWKLYDEVPVTLRKVRRAGDHVSVFADSDQHFRPCPAG